MVTDECRVQLGVEGGKRRAFKGRCLLLLWGCRKRAGGNERPATACPVGETKGGEEARLCVCCGGTHDWARVLLLGVLRPFAAGEVRREKKRVGMLSLRGQPGREKLLFHHCWGCLVCVPFALQLLAGFGPVCCASHA